jgi:uncharacterized membrane protein YbaN (DUF454 family)
MIGCGILALGLGAIGIFVPLLPTAPFVLLAAFCFSRGSERLHRWLAEHPRFGHYVRDWEAEQVIPPVGKYAASFTMVPSVSWVIASRDIPFWLEGLMALTVVGVLWFVWSRPARRSALAREDHDRGTGKRLGRRTRRLETGSSARVEDAADSSANPTPRGLCNRVAGVSVAGSKKTPPPTSPSAVATE